MKKFLILSLGLLGGLAIGFFAYGDINSLLNKVSDFGKKDNYTHQQKVLVEPEIAEQKAMPEQATGPEEMLEEEIVIEEAVVQPAEEDIEPAEEVKAPEMTDTEHGKNGIAAVVNGKNITVDEIRYTYDANPQIKDKIPFEDFYEKAVRVYVEGKIIYDAAVASKILESPEFLKQVELLKQDIARKVFIETAMEKAVDEEAVKKLYEEYKQTFVPQKEIKAKHILVDTKELADEVVAKLGEGRKFEDLAEQYSKEPADLGYFTKDMMIPEFGEAAFATKVGEYTKAPVLTEYGYHIILVEDVRDSKPASYEEAVPQLKQMMKSKVVEGIYSGLKKNADVVVYGFDGKEIPFEEKNK